MSWFLKFLLAAAFFCAQQLPAITAAEREEIRALYKRGLAGDKYAVEQCIVKLEKAVATEPDNQIARVYLGSAYTLRSRDLWFGPRKLEALKRGLALTSGGRDIQWGKLHNPAIKPIKENGHG